MISYKILHRFALAILLVSVFVTLRGFNQTATGYGIIRVPDDYPTIQAAVDASVPGDTILVANGTYYEHINIGEHSNLKIQGDNRLTIVDGNGTGGIFQLDYRSKSIEISGFTISNGTSPSEYGVASGIYVGVVEDTGNSELDLTIINNDIVNCGVGIETSGNDYYNLGFGNIRIVNNSISGNGKGIRLCVVDQVQILNNSITGNYEIGIDLYDPKNVEIIGNFLSGNKEGLYGDSHKYASPANVLVANNTVTLSDSSIHIGPSRCGGRYNITRNEFYRNRAGLKLTGESDYYYLVRGTVWNNSFEDNDYGIFQQGSRFDAGYGDWKFYHNNFVNNTQSVHSENVPENVSIWNDDYPSGGNYWSDYDGLDFYSGAFQNETGKDGICDVPYIIDDNNMDRWPVVSPWPHPPWLPAARFSYLPNIPNVNQTVSFDASDSFDFDGDITNYFWDFGDGTNTSGASGTTHSYTDLGTFKITLEVTDNDGLKNIKTKNIMVDRFLSMISLTPTYSEMLFGQSMFLIGSINPLRPSVNVSIWQRFGAQDWHLFESLTTDKNSIFSYLWTPAFVETYEFKANWTGDYYTYSAESTIVTVICSHIPTSVSIVTSCPSTFVGFKVRINGTLLDTYGNPLSNETVVLSYTFPGIETWTPITSDLTDEFGGYEAEWYPPATGYFVLKAEWLGNSTHAGTNKTATLTSLPYENEFVFSVESNSTITNLAFNTTDWSLAFTATGPDGTSGYARITVAKTLVYDVANIRVYLDNKNTQFSIVSIGDSWLLNFEYSHSTHSVVVDLDVNGRDTIPPTAEAGPNQIVNQGTLVNFDGSGSTDNRGITSYSWTFVDGVFRKLTGKNPTYTFTNAGIFAVTLNVTDAAGNWDTDTMTVTVRDVTPPIAQAGSNQTVNEGALVHFSGSGSSDNVEIVSYVWTFMDGTAKTLNGTGPTYTFHVPARYLVTLNVTDAAGNWNTDTVTITVLDATPPTILTPIQSPAGNVTLAQVVYISVNITDAGSGVKNATLLYTVNNGLVRIRVLSRNVATGYYETAIPGQLAGAWVKYEIKAYDNAGNIRVESNAGQYYVYQVTVPEFPSLLAVFLLMAATLLALVMSKRKHAMKAISSFWKTLFP